MSQKNPVNLSGKQYGMLTVIKCVGRTTWRRSYYECKCKCGSVYIYSDANLQSGATTDCGCEVLRLARQAKFVHGRDSCDRTYMSWYGMKRRCSYKPRYVSRGIKVCERWAVFLNFLADMGERPAETTLDRIDNDKGYSPENCRWANAKTQRRNTETLHPITYNGVTQLITDWENDLGLNANVLARRLKRGWSLEKALTGPRT